MYEYWGPNMRDRPMAMGGLRAKVENRDGNAILASVDRVKSESSAPQAQKLLIMLSDGEPSADNYRGDVAYSHTRKCVKYAESRGWTVIQVGFSGARKYSMEKMFTNWVYIEDTDKLGDEVSKIIRKVIKV
jgi:nitric oxide reductase activation protein